MSKSISNVSINNGVVKFTVPAGGDMLFYAFQQTANNTAVHISNPSDSTTLSGKSNTGGALTYLSGARFFLSGSSQTFQVTLEINGRAITTGKVKYGVANDLTYGGQSWQDTIVITCEDSTDNDYNDLTVIGSWFKKAK